MLVVRVALGDPCITTGVPATSAEACRAGIIEARMMDIQRGFRCMGTSEMEIVSIRPFRARRLLRHQQDTRIHRVTAPNSQIPREAGVGV
jgi:hypothetical protein